LRHQLFECSALVTDADQADCVWTHKMARTGTLFVDVADPDRIG
jgi:hypothetical protein